MASSFWQKACPLAKWRRNMKEQTDPWPIARLLLCIPWLCDSVKHEFNKTGWELCIMHVHSFWWFLWGFFILFNIHFTLEECSGYMKIHQFLCRALPPCRQWRVNKQVWNISLLENTVCCTDWHSIQLESLQSIRRSEMWNENALHLCTKHSYSIHRHELPQGTGHPVSWCIMARDHCYKWWTAGKTRVCQIWGLQVDRREASSSVSAGPKNQFLTCFHFS